MAAITFTDPGPYKVLRNATAQANTGQTDWITVPPWASYMYVYLNVTAVTGTTPLVTELNFLVPDPVLLNDSTVLLLKEHASITDISGVAQVVVAVGPGVTLADDYTNGATGDSFMSLNAALPSHLGIQLAFDRTTGDETYTYTLAVNFKG